MIHTDYAGAARKALLSVLGADAYTRAEALRPSANPFSDADAAELGEIHGYRYLKRGSSPPVIALPGETDGAAEWFMDLTQGFPVSVQPGDRLRFADGTLRRVSLVRGSGAFNGKDFYRLYRLEAI